MLGDLLEGLSPSGYPFSNLGFNFTKDLKEVIL